MLTMLSRFKVTLDAPGKGTELRLGLREGERRGSGGEGDGGGPGGEEGGGGCGSGVGDVWLGDSREEGGGTDGLTKDLIK